MYFFSKPSYRKALDRKGRVFVSCAEEHVGGGADLGLRRSSDDPDTVQRLPRLHLVLLLHLAGANHPVPATHLKLALCWRRERGGRDGGREGERGESVCVCGGVCWREMEKGGRERERERKKVEENENERERDGERKREEVRSRDRWINREKD